MLIRYGISFSGCISTGSTLDEARAMALEALTVYTDFMNEPGHPLPAPMTMEDAIKAAHPEGLFGTMMIRLEA